MAVLFLLNDESMRRGRECLVLLFFFVKESCIQSLSNIKVHEAVEQGVSCLNPFSVGILFSLSSVCPSSFSNEGLIAGLNGPLSVCFVRFKQEEGRESTGKRDSAWIFLLSTLYTACVHRLHISGSHSLRDSKWA